MVIFELPMAFLFGIASIMSPCTLFIAPIIASKLSSTRSLLVFSAGLISSFIAVGIASAAAGALITSYYGGFAFWLAGVITLLSSFSLLDLIGFRGPNIAASSEKMGNLLLGLSFGLVSLSCIGPYLVPVVAVVIAEGSMLTGAVIMAAYGAGFLAPFIAFGYYLKDKTKLSKIAMIGEKARPYMGYGLMAFAIILFSIPQL